VATIINEKFSVAIVINEEFSVAIVVDEIFSEDTFVECKVFVPTLFNMEPEYLSWCSE
jgi:hypothetical protein